MSTHPQLANNFSKQSEQLSVTDQNCTLLIVSTLVNTLDLLQRQGIHVEGARIKIHMAADDSAERGLFREVRQVTPTPESACKDVMMTNGSGLPEQILNDMRFNRTRVQFYSSDSAKEYINMHIFTRRVSGLESEIVGDVFDMLLDEDCYPFFFWWPRMRYVSWEGTW